MDFCGTVIWKSVNIVFYVIFVRSNMKYMKYKIDYVNPLIEHLNKCFGKNSKGILCISNNNYSEDIVIKKRGNKYCIEQFGSDGFVYDYVAIFKSMCDTIFDDVI